MCSVHTIQPCTISRHFTQSHVCRVQVFSSNWPPALLAEWLGFFYVLLPVTWGWNRYWNKSQHRKLTLEKKTSPATPAGTRICNLSITSPALQPLSYSCSVGMSRNNLPLHYAVCIGNTQLVAALIAAGELIQCLHKQSLCMLKRVHWWYTFCDSFDTVIVTGELLQCLHEQSLFMLKRVHWWHTFCDSFDTVIVTGELLQCL